MIYSIEQRKTRTTSSTFDTWLLAAFFIVSRRSSGQKASKGFHITWRERACFTAAILPGTISMQSRTIGRAPPMACKVPDERRFVKSSEACCTRGAGMAATALSKTLLAMFSVFPINLLMKTSARKWNSVLTVACTAISCSISAFARVLLSKSWRNHELMNTAGRIFLFSNGKKKRDRISALIITYKWTVREALRNLSSLLSSDLLKRQIPTL